MTAPPIETLTASDPFSLLTPARPTVFVLVSSSPTPDAAFERVAYQLQGTTAFYHLQSPPSPPLLHSASLAPSIFPAVLYYTKGSTIPESMSLSPSHPSSELRRWVEERRLPLVSVLSNDNFERLTTDERTLALLVADERNPQLPSYVDALYPLAAQYKRHVVLATVNVDKYRKFLSQFLDVESGKTPALVAFKSFPDLIYKVSEDATGATASLLFCPLCRVLTARLCPCVPCSRTSSRRPSKR